jgi:hypothetical protein
MTALLTVPGEGSLTEIHSGMTCRDDPGLVTTGDQPALSSVR